MGKSKSMGFGGMGFGGMDEVWIRKTNGATAGVAIAHARMTLSQDHVRRLGQILEALVALGHTSVSRTGMDNSLCRMTSTPTAAHIIRGKRAESEL